MSLFTQLKSYQALQAHFSNVENVHMRDLFAADEQRFNVALSRAKDRMYLFRSINKWRY